ncbi:hypothetical protein R75461_08046 [Paraburkholderia nemoris]|nr:hypothetical protein R75461_08046 [Paraburkholderia nemoris]
MYGKHVAFKGLLYGFIAVASWLCAGTAVAGLYDNVMSVDESPVEFSLGAARYRIPRNYLSQMSDWSGGPQEYAAIRVTYPGLKPFSQETESCMRHKTPCRIYEVNLRDKFQAWEDGGANREEVEHPEWGKPGPYGFTLFTRGPENARSDFYRKIVDGKPIMFFCLPYDVDGKRGAVCNHAAHTSSGATLFYFFDLNGLRDAVEVDEALRQLVDGFSIKENK